MRVLTAEEMRRAEKLAVEAGSSYEALMEQAGQGAAFCSRLALSAWPQPFAAYPLKPPAYREICLVCADGVALSQAARWLKDHIAAFFEEGQGPGPDGAG